MLFSSLFGLEQPIRSLRNALAHEQIAGTYLFVGPAGVGKTALALAFAQAAACLDPRQNPFDACGECESCRRLETGTHPEVHVIAPAGEQTQIWQFWDRDNRPPGVLQHTLNYSPAIGRKRVYIIERADTLNESAANSLLKALEEPPPYALFILLSPHAARMLPTILSRSQLIRLTPSPVSALAAHLVKSMDIDPDRAWTIAACSEGRIGAALRLARSPAVETEIAKLVDLAETIAEGTPIRALKIGESIRKLATGLKALAETDSGGAPPFPPLTKGGEGGGATPSEDSEAAPKERVGRRQLGIVLEMLATVYRDLAALSLGGDQAEIVHGARRASLAAAARNRPPQWWMSGIEALLAARRRVDQNASIPLLTDWLAMRLTSGSRG